MQLHFKFSRDIGCYAINDLKRGRESKRTWWKIAGGGRDQQLIGNRSVNHNILIIKVNMSSFNRPYFHLDLLGSSCTQNFPRKKKTIFPKFLPSRFSYVNSRYSIIGKNYEKNAFGYKYLVLPLKITRGIDRKTFQEIASSQLLRS